MRVRYDALEEDWYVINDQDEVVRFGLSSEEEAYEWIKREAGADDKE